jgi:hypothetical protein
MKRALLAGATIAIVAACGGPASRSSTAPPASAAELAAQKAEFEPYVPAFQSLEAALDARDDELAMRILARILARDPHGVALERAQAFERILEGRAWVASISVRLEAVRVGVSDQWAVRAIAKNSDQTELTLRGVPPTLRTYLLGVSPNGMEQRFSRQAPVESLAQWKLPPGVETSSEIGVVEIPPGGALAVRALFVLEFLPGEIVRESQVRPATNISVGRAEALRLANFLPVEPVDPAELARYVRDERIRTPPLLERAVRIPLDQRARALDLLTPVVLELPSGELEKLAVALRWLSGQSQLGADARSWRQWLDERSRMRAKDLREGRPPSSDLDLPGEGSYRH